MSSSLFLYRYPDAPDGRYIEDTAQKIEECSIDNTVLKDIEDLEPWIELVVYEEKGSDTHNNVTCIDNSKLELIRKQIAQAFARRVRDIEATLDTAAGLDDSISSLRTICNIYFLLRIKFEQYATDDRVVIQLV